MWRPSQKAIVIFMGHGEMERRVRGEETFKSSFRRGRRQLIEGGTDFHGGPDSSRHHEK